MTLKEINLFEGITQALARLGHPNPSEWLNDPHISQAMNHPDAKERRFQINRYWRIKLGRCNENTSYQRFCLFPEDTDRAYLDIFIDRVVPFIVENKL